MGKKLQIFQRIRKVMIKEFLTLYQHSEEIVSFAGMAIISQSDVKCF